MEKLKIFIYTFENPAAIYVAKALAKSGKITALIVQNPLSLSGKLRLLSARIRQYGIWKVADEIMFKIYYAIFLASADARLRKECFPKDFFDMRMDDQNIRVYRIDSINSGAGKKLMATLRPDVVIMESREMIDEDVLRMSRMGFIGCHPGIMPEYRGAYASFWAMRYREPDKVGLSIYMADAGVDTGGIISQRPSPPKFNIRHFKVESERLMMEGVKDLLAAIELAEKGHISTYKKDSSRSRFFSHVGFTDYLKAQK